MILGKIVLTLGLLLYLILYVNLNQILDTFAKAKPGTVFLILILLIFNVFVQFKRWEFVSHKVLKNFNKKEILSSLFHGFAWGIITPLRAGEFFARKIPMKESSTFSIVMATFVDKFLLMPVVFFVGGVFALFFIAEYFSWSSFLLILITLLFLLAFAVMMLVIFYYYKAKKLLNKLIPAKGWLRNFYLKLENFSRLKKKDIALLLLLSSILYLIYTSQFALSIFAFTGGANFWTCYWISNLVIFSKNFIPPVTLGEVGVREAFTIYFAAQFGIPDSVAFDAAVLIFLINILLPSLAGIYFVLKEK